MNDISEQQLKKLASRIKEIKDYRHMHIRDISICLGLSLNYTFVATATLRERGMIAPKSDIGMTDLARYHQLDKLLATKPEADITAAVKMVYDADTPKTRYKLRRLIEACGLDGLDMSNISLLDIEPIIPNSRRNKKSPLRFISINQVEQQALAAFVGICQMNGGRHAA